MTELYIGLMSGTSLDAVDAALVSIDTNTATLVASHKHTIPNTLRQQILNTCTGQNTTLPEIGLLDHKLGKLYASAALKLLEQAQLNANQITAIGNHGQTVFHQPEGDSPFTIQLGDANLIAATTGIDTIADFRRLDIALGGQGAPLVPAFHEFLFPNRVSTTVVLNIGGIANITVLPKNGEVSGFDTGPGNILMDAWCEKHTGQQYDHNGEWAKQGLIDTALLNQLMSDPYLTKKPPKSTGREHYNLAWFETQRTLCEFTGQSIAQQVQSFKDGTNCELLVCGGGVNNPLLMDVLQQHLPRWRISPTDERGIPADYLEAMAFGWLARQRIHKQHSNLPSVTGAKHKASLGVLYAAAKDFS